MKTKKEWKIFLITDFEKEETYLSEMHRKGWKFTGIQGRLLYCFEACEPADVVYKIDFKRNNLSDQESYHQLYQDYGWEYVAVCNGFHTFRKSNVEDGDIDIFSDDPSKLDMIEQIFRRRFLLLLFFYLIAFGYGWVFKKPDFVLGVAMIAVPVTIYLFYRFYQLRKEFKKD